jgi:hypothetical protein
MCRGQGRWGGGGSHRRTSRAAAPHAANVNPLCARQHGARRSGRSRHVSVDASVDTDTPAGDWSAAQARGGGAAWEARGRRAVGWAARALGGGCGGAITCNEAQLPTEELS